MMIANIKLSPFRMKANFLPNSATSSLSVAKPTMVNVVKKAVEDITSIPASIKEPTSGNATKAGIIVTLPKPAKIQWRTTD